MVTLIRVRVNENSFLFLPFVFNYSYNISANRLARFLRTSVPVWASCARQKHIVSCFNIIKDTQTLNIIRAKFIHTLCHFYVMQSYAYNFVLNKNGVSCEWISRFTFPTVNEINFPKRISNWMFKLSINFSIYSFTFVFYVYFILISKESKSREV